jgi:hypothetical protein
MLFLLFGFGGLLRMRQRVVEGAAVYDIFSVCYGVGVEVLSVS